VCGVGIIIAPDRQLICRELVDRIDRRLAHRGPDAFGLALYDRNLKPADCSSAAVALMHRRLAIIDLDVRSNQPMASSDGRYVLIFNGEIYNYIELREELRRAGHHFITASDTEVLLAAFSKWREACLPRLLGMFAVLDRKRREIFVARDAFGIKPLYWSGGHGFLAFASEIPALLELPRLKRTLDRSRALSFLARGRSDHGEGTLFSEVRQLPAGAYAYVPVDRPEQPQPRLWWSPKPTARASHKANAEMLRQRFLSSIEVHLRSDVSVGCALSGGIDSSAIVLGARAVAGRSLRVRTFSFVADSPELDESSYVAEVVRASGAEAHFIRIIPDEFVGDMDRLLDCQGEPFGSPSIYAQYRVMQAAAAAGVKVMLDGQGADELFAGYRPFIARRLSELLRSLDLRNWLGLLQAASGERGTMLGLLMQSLEPFLPPMLREPVRQLVGVPLVPSWVDANRLAAGAAALRCSVRIKSGLKDALVESLTESVLPALLRYEDRNSMAFSVESRVPFLTTGLAELAYSLPSDQLIDATAVTKKAFRDAMRGIVPDRILDRRDKVSFTTPNSWVGKLLPRFQQVLDSELARSQSWLDSARLGRLLETGDRMGQPSVSAVWRTVILLRWMQRFEVELA
jgi:asparagine synthase (glutamine-hydrolysing)